jgi:hypothetical protein
MNYNASVVNFYNATGRIARFKNKKIYFEKRSSLLQRWRCSCKFIMNYNASAVKSLLRHE